MRIIKVLLAAGGIGGLAVWVGLSAMPLPARLSPALSPVVYSAEGVLLRTYLSQEDMWRFPVALEELPPFFIKGLLCLEDKRFFGHPGIDPLALVRALMQNVRAGRVVSGGSTITMQVARLLEPRRRTLRAKLIEAWRALQLEWHLSKTYILTLYLTYAPYGGNVEGITAAAYFYFGRGPASLTPAEAALLYMLPQAPGRWEKYTSHQWQEARQRVLQRLAGCGLLTPADVQQAHVAPLPAARQPFPLYAAHLADYLRQRYPQQGRLQTTIAIDVQRLLEQLVRRQQQTFRTKGVQNIAILVVENATRAVRGVIGNFDYLGTTHGQSIATFTVPRSPGSTLKPLLYALALEQAAILPESLLLDVPTRFARYAPENFSGTYAGLVTAETALSHSLNVPFVHLLQTMGVDRFLNFLELGGLRLATERQGLGLSMIVGGFEVTPLELVQLYTNLANGGQAGELRWLATEEALAPPTLWLSPGAVSLTHRALAKRDRPDFPQRKYVAVSTPEVRWKTGTSQGRRDAWSIGYDNRYTVLVWLGNLDRTPSAALTGADSAAPVMFEILEALRTRSSDQAHGVSNTMPGLVEVEVCAFSGDRASAFCPLTRQVWGIHARLPAHTCRFHRQILRDRDSGQRVVRGCDQGLRTELASVLDLPASVLQWMRPTLREHTLLPAFHSRCTHVPVQRGVLNIRSPVDSGHYLLLPSFGQRVVYLPLDLHISGATADVSCLLNGQQLHVEQMEFTPVLQLGHGRYHLFCSSMDGASDEVYFEVALAETPLQLPRE
jgi:penicillin-binding protein 1C